MHDDQGEIKYKVDTHLTDTPQVDEDIGGVVRTQWAIGDLCEVVNKYDVES